MTRNNTKLQCNFKYISCNFDNRIIIIYYMITMTFKCLLVICIVGFLTLIYTQYFNFQDKNQKKSQLTCYSLPISDPLFSALSLGYCLFDIPPISILNIAKINLWFWIKQVYLWTLLVFDWRIMAINLHLLSLVTSKYIWSLWLTASHTCFLSLNLQNKDQSKLQSLIYR